MRISPREKGEGKEGGEGKGEREREREKEREREREREIEVYIMYINDVLRLNYRRFPSQQGVRKFYRVALYLVSLFKSGAPGQMSSVTKGTAIKSRKFIIHKIYCVRSSRLLRI